MRDVRRPINPLSDRFMDKLRMHMRSRNLAYSTEKVYSQWTLRFIRHNNMKHPSLMGVKSSKNTIVSPLDQVIVNSASQ